MVLLISSCTINPYQLDENVKNYEGDFHKCATPDKVGLETLKLNLDSLEGSEYNLNKISKLLGNPIDKKNIDNIDYYYFGSPGEARGCSVSIPVKDNKISGISVYGSTNSCSGFTENAVKQIGNFYQLYVGWQFALGEGNCGNWAIFKK